MGDLAGFGFTYRAGQAFIVLNAVADATIIVILTSIVDQYPAIINGATNVSILYAAQDWIERESSLQAKWSSEPCIKINSASLGIMISPKELASVSASSLRPLVIWRNQGVRYPSKLSRKLGDGAAGQPSTSRSTVILSECTAPIVGGTVHSARICSAPRNAGARRGRGRDDARAGRGNLGGRGGRGN